MSAPLPNRSLIYRGVAKKLLTRITFWIVLEVRVAERFLLILAKICVEKILRCGADVQNGLLWDLVSYECLDRFSF